jgi:hypothetical protein
MTSSPKSPCPGTLPFSPEELVGSESRAVLHLVNRLYVLGKEIRLSDDLSAAVAECVEVLRCRVKRGEEEAMQFLMACLHRFTIRELQEMNRDGVPWVLDVLFAIVGCGIETARHQEAQLVSWAVQKEQDGDKMMDLMFSIVEHGRTIGRIALHKDIDGSCQWVSTTRLKSVEWGAPL